MPSSGLSSGRRRWGLQFHPEVTEQAIRCWSAWDPATACRADELVTNFLSHTSDYEQTAKKLILNFLYYAGLLTKELSNVKKG
jgi:GMP synthase-like glutamine amidotransferase